MTANTAPGAPAMAVATGMTQNPPLALADHPRSTARPVRSEPRGVLHHATTMIAQVNPAAMSGQARSTRPSSRQAARIETPTDTTTICHRMTIRQVSARRSLRALATPTAAPSA